MADLTSAELEASLFADRGRYFYVGYIAAIALVDLSVLLLLLRLRPWQHVLITISLSFVGICCISASLYYATASAHRRSTTIRKLIHSLVQEAVADAEQHRAR